MDTPDDNPYLARQESGTFVVHDASGRTVVTSHDQSTADNFVLLLNAAYHKGYKAGYRNGKNSQAKKQ